MGTVGCFDWVDINGMRFGMWQQALAGAGVSFERANLVMGFHATIAASYDDPGRSNLSAEARDEYHREMLSDAERVELRRFIKPSAHRGWPTWAHRATDPGAA